ncbi:peroxide stress protein YaaA [Alphaproteobacteria bacterium LSUCC0719]
MLVVISPAKKLDMNPDDRSPVTAPAFAADAETLAGVARDLTHDDLRSLMSISPALAALNAERFAAFGTQPVKAAALAFAGDTYQGLEAPTLDDDEMAWAQNHLRILSGLYGVLRPMDAIEPYRLEMGSRLKTEKGASLYEYWGGRLAEALNAQAAAVGSQALVNCASQEYFAAVDRDVLEIPVITPVFKEIKDGKSRIVSFFAKKARGAMARHIVQNRLTDPADLKSFSVGGYQYVAEASDSATMVFERDHPDS